jgi:hypothetical protein
MEVVLCFHPAARLRGGKALHRGRARLEARHGGFRNGRHRRHHFRGRGRGRGKFRGGHRRGGEFRGGVDVGFERGEGFVGRGWIRRLCKSVPLFSGAVQGLVPGQCRADGVTDRSPQGRVFRALGNVGVVAREDGTGIAGIRPAAGERAVGILGGLDAGKRRLAVVGLEALARLWVGRPTERPSTTASSPAPRRAGPRASCGRRARATRAR